MRSGSRARSLVRASQLDKSYGTSLFDSCNVFNKGTLSPVCLRSYSSSGVLSLPPHQLYPMPALSPTMTMGTISNWNIEEGSSFKEGDVICEIETDKATVDFEAQEEGVLAKILQPQGSELEVGIPICVVCEEEEDVDSFKDFVADEGGSVAVDVDIDSKERMGLGAPVETKEVAVTVSSDHLLMPAARHMAHSKGLDVTGLSGSGKGGRITKGDVIVALNSGVTFPSLTNAKTTTTASVPSTTEKVTAPLPPTSDSLDVTIPSITTSGSYKDVPNNNMRKVIARRLTESKSQVPHFYSTVEVELDNVLKLRKDLAAKDVKVSVNDLIIKGSAMALRDVPEVNASYVKGQAQMSDSVDISVAVATPGGLITPIVPNTDSLGLADISAKVKDLAGRAREGKLAPEEYQGGSFCISNLGMFGINEFSAVINPPQAAILAVGGGVKKVVPTEFIESKEIQEDPGIKTVMTARLSADRRVVDEATVGLFLAALRNYMQKPELLLL